MYINQFIRIFKCNHNDNDHYDDDDDDDDNHDNDNDIENNNVYGENIQVNTRV